MSAFRPNNRSGNRTVDVLPPDVPGRPRNTAVRRKRFDVVDADFVVLAPTPAARRNSSQNDNARTATAPGGRKQPSPALRFLLGIVLPAGRLCEHRLQHLPARAFTALVALAFIAVFAFSGGFSALHATLFQARGAPALEITGISAALNDSNGMRILSVYGTVENRSDAARRVPLLAVAVGEPGQAVTTRHVELAHNVLPAGDRGHFALRIPHGGGKIPKVSVSFAAADASGN